MFFLKNATSGVADNILKKEYFFVCQSPTGISFSGCNLRAIIWLQLTADVLRGMHVCARVCVCYLR